MLFTFIARLGDVIVKVATSESRTSPELIRVEGTVDRLSFLSGLVVGVTLVFGLLLILAPRLRLSPAVRTVLQVVSLLLIASVGLGRIFVGAHWPTDVLGGYLYAALFLIPVLAWQGTRLSNEE